MMAQEKYHYKCSKLQNSVTEIDKIDADSQPFDRKSGQRRLSTVNNVMSTEIYIHSNGMTRDQDKNLTIKDNSSSKSSLETGTITKLTHQRRSSLPREERTSHQRKNNDDSNYGTNVIQNRDSRARKNPLKQSSAGSSEMSAKINPRFFVSVFERPYTKEEVMKALPRRSHFNCHEKAMKEAGLEVGNAVLKRKTDLLKAKFKSIDSLSTTSLTESVQDLATDRTVSATQEFDSNWLSTPDKLIETVVAANASHESTATDTNVVNRTTVPEASTVKSQGPKRKRQGNEKLDLVECKPLSLYLEYIQENRQDYLKHVQRTRPQTLDQLNVNLIKLGCAFELRHQGGSPEQPSDDIIVTAAKALRPRTADPVKIYKQSKDNVPWPSHASMRPLRPQSHDRRQDKNVTAAAREEDRVQIELATRKQLAEDWSRSVPTHILNQAKLQTLREMGHDDRELTKWWKVFKYCYYIRQTHS